MQRQRGKGSCVRRGQPPCLVEQEAAQWQGSRRLVQPLVIICVMAWCDVLLLLLLRGTDSCQNLGEQQPAWHWGSAPGSLPTKEQPCGKGRRGQPGARRVGVGDRSSTTKVPAA